MQTYPRAAATSTGTRGESFVHNHGHLGSPDSSTTDQAAPDVAGFSEPAEDAQLLLLQGRCYSETSAPPPGRSPPSSDGGAPLNHEQRQPRVVSARGGRQRSTTDAKRGTTIKRFPTIMTPSYGPTPLRGGGGGGIGRGSLLHRQFYSKAEKLTVLSPDMEAKIYERICRSLGEKYGSLEEANRAAVTIQKAYRGYKLRRHFEEIRREGGGGGGGGQLTRCDSLDTKERRRMLTMIRDRAGAGGSDARPSRDASEHGDGAESDVGSGEEEREAPARVEGRQSGGVVVMRRTKSQCAVLTRRIREEGDGEEEEGEEGGKDGVLTWNRMVGAHLFNRSVFFLVSEFVCCL